MEQDKGKEDRQSLVDKGSLGAEPSETYQERVKGLDNVVRECMHISQDYAGIESPSGKHFYASVLFTALCTRAVSLLTLVPHTPWASKLIEHWDYASVAGITRTILELRLAFHYLCAEACSQDEWDCRWNIFNLHDCTSRRRMFEASSMYQRRCCDAVLRRLLRVLGLTASFATLLLVGCGRLSSSIRLVKSASENCFPERIRS